MAEAESKVRITQRSISRYVAGNKIKFEFENKVND